MDAPELLKKLPPISYKFAIGMIGIAFAVGITFNNANMIASDTKVNKQKLEEINNKFKLYLTKEEFTIAIKMNQANTGHEKKLIIDELSDIKGRISRKVDPLEVEIKIVDNRLRALEIETAKKH